MKGLSILGATGSIGIQALDVLRKSNGEYKLVGVTANSSVDKMKEIIKEFNPSYVAMMDKKSANEIEDFCKENKYNIEIYSGLDGLIKIATLNETDIVLTSVVGMIGLKPTLAAIEAGKDIALANKETLVVAGDIVMARAHEKGVKILPVDSEHSAIFQALQGNDIKTLKKIILTASGGPFRKKNLNELEDISVEEALNHPNWSMGNKITIDSATLMNKGLEVIEAHHLFNCDYDMIQVLVHPESIIHSMVEYSDSSIIAQLGSPDMRLPIQYALNYPIRKGEIADSLDFYKISQLNFERPNVEVFKCLSLAFEAGRRGGLMPTILNGANEVAVALFLKRRIKFLEIAEIIREAMVHFEDVMTKSLTIENVIEVDNKVREYVLNKYS